MRELSRRLLAAIVVTVAVSAPATAFAGPWTKSLGDYYTKVGQSLYVANGFIDTSGEFQSGTQYTGHTTSLYAEIGLAKRLQVIAYLPFTVAVNTFPDDWKYMRGGLGDSKLGVQWSPFAKHAFALRVDSSIPLYDVGAYDGPFEEKIPQLGDGQVDHTFGVSYGLGLPKIQSYTFAELGYLHRTEWFIGKGPAAERDFTDGLSWGAQFGRTFFGRPILAVGGNGVVPFANNRFTKAYASVGLTAYVPIVSKLAVEAGAFFTPWARNSARGQSYSLGVSYSD